MCACVRIRERVSVRGIERVDCVCLGVCLGDKERVRVCVRDRYRERERKRKREMLMSS